MYEEYKAKRAAGEKCAYITAMLSEKYKVSETALVEYEKMVETLNPAYAEKKHQAESIATLQKRADAQEKKLDMILGKLDELFTQKK